MTTKKSRLKELEDGLYRLAHKTAEALQLTSEGFNLHSRRHLEEAMKLAKEVHETHTNLTQGLLKELGDHKEELDQVKKLITIPGHLERIGDCCESIIAVTHTKIKEGTLFSDKAVSEVNAIFNGTLGLVKSAGDIILTKNVLLTKHIVVESDNLCNKADDSATMHEERLILGICNPKSGSMFLDMLDSLKSILFHLKKIAESTL
jgi:Na+/phosphate symporter